MPLELPQVHWKALVGVLYMLRFIDSHVLDIKELGDNGFGVLPRVLKAGTTKNTSGKSVFGQLCGRHAGLTIESAPPMVRQTTRQCLQFGNQIFLPTDPTDKSSINHR